MDTGLRRHDEGGTFYESVYLQSSASLLPQYFEEPPNTEVKPIISRSSAVLSCLSQTNVIKRQIKSYDPTSPVGRLFAVLLNLHGSGSSFKESHRQPLLRDTVLIGG